MFAFRSVNQTPIFSESENMGRNVSVQTYLPRHVADWVGDEAGRVGLSRSLWIGNIVVGLYQGQELRGETRKNAEQFRRQLTFIVCALDGLLAGHPDNTLRGRVRDAFKHKVDQLQQEYDQ